jgi:glycosyltransferase involved in cell wall biosynthesis
MKIIVIIEASYLQPGVFFQGIELVEDLTKYALQSDTIEVVITNGVSVPELMSRGFTVHLVKFNVPDRLLRLFSATTVFPFVQKYLRLTSHFEKSLIKIGANFLVFATQSSTPAVISKTIFASQVHDIAYLEYPEFSESSNYGESRIKLRYLEIVTRASSLVITESISLKNSVIDRFDLNPKRVLAIPHSVPKDIISSTSAPMTSKPKFQNGEVFYLYPAQFWNHKNHRVIVLALKKLHQASKMAHVVFVGQDQGLLEPVKKLVMKMGLQDYVHFMGFQSRSELIELYRNCVALVMTTYFGPTNVPPMEAWSLGVPVIYSQHLSEDLGDSVIPVDVDSIESVANGMQIVLEEVYRERLINQGRLMLERLHNLREAQIRIMLNQIRIISDRVLE